MDMPAGLPTALQPVPRVSRSLRAVAALMLALIVGVTVQQLARQRSAILEQTETELGRLDMAFAEQTGRAIETVDLVMRDFADQMRVPHDLQPAYRTPLGERMQRRIDGIRQVRQLKIANADGLLIATTATPLEPAAGQTLPPAGLALVQRFRTSAAPALMFSDPFRLPDGTWTVLLARSFNGPDERFGGIVAASLNLQYFQDFYRAVGLTGDSVIMLHRRDGVVLAAYPEREGLIGADYSALPPFHDILSRDIAGTMVMQRPDDGRNRVVAMRALRNFPLAVNISVAADDVLASWRVQSVTAVIACLTVAILVGALLLRLARESRQVELLLTANTAARATAEAASARMIRQMEERERTEAALRQAQRMEAIGQLTGGVAHDFNNLLTVLLGNIDLMQAAFPGDRRAPDPVLHTRLERMRAAAERGATLTDQLLAFSRRQPLVPRPASLNTVIKGMTDLVQSATGSNIELTLRLAPDLWLVLVDTAQIELVILNLALNARDAMPRGGRLTIETRNTVIAPADAMADLPAGDYVMVRVTDSGGGMTEDVRAKAFEPFFTTKGPGIGSGLGLSQVYGVARQSGGTAQIDSLPGEGTYVTLFLPRTSEELGADRRNGRDGSDAITRGARILLVDDDEAVRSTTALILEAIGYAITTAESGEIGMARLEAGLDIDLLLTDVAMLGMNGAELADKVRELRPGLPIVFISGYADPNAIARREKLRPLVRKPFRATDLAAEIENALAGC